MDNPSLPKMAIPNRSGTSCKNHAGGFHRHSALETTRSRQQAFLVNLTKSWL